MTTAEDAVVRFSEQLLDYSLIITEKHLKVIETQVGQCASTGRAGIVGTLHRVSGGKGSTDLLIAAR